MMLWVISLCLPCGSPPAQCWARVGWWRVWQWRWWWGWVWLVSVCLGSGCRRPVEGGGWHHQDWHQCRVEPCPHCHPQSVPCVFRGRWWGRQDPGEKYNVVQISRLPCDRGEWTLNSALQNKVVGVGVRRFYPDIFTTLKPRPWP